MTDQSPAAPTPRETTPLVTPEWLAARLPDPGLLVLDIRSSVDGGGRAAYEAARIPGAGKLAAIEDAPGSYVRVMATD